MEVIAILSLSLDGVSIIDIAYVYFFFYVCSSICFICIQLPSWYFCKNLVV
jgi:hypothetical protein